MTHAELLRKHATDATNEGGMWFSGEYLSRIAETAKSLEDENTKLRELVRDMYLCSDETCTDCEHHDYSGEGFWCKRGIGWKKARMRELGIEVDKWAKF